MNYFWPGSVNTHWGPGPVNTNWGPGPVNTNLVPGPVNTNWGPGPGTKQRAKVQEIQIPSSIPLCIKFHFKQKLIKI